MRHIALLLLSLLFAPPAHAAAGGVPVWQSHQSVHGEDEDARLERAVAVSLPDSDVAAVVAELSTRSGVALACGDDLRSRPITVYLPGTRLKDVMAELAPFLRCEWWVGRRDGELIYELRKTDSLRTAEAEYVARRWAIWAEPSPASAADVETILHRLQEYAAALSLSEKELVRTHQDSDPWLLVALLDPVSRGFIPFLSGLSREQIAQVVSQAESRGSLRFRVQDLPAGLREHVAQWVDSAAVADAAPLDEAHRFSSWGERWAHATLLVSWSQSGVPRLSVGISIPDMGNRNLVRAFVTSQNARRRWGYEDLLSVRQWSAEEQQALRSKAEAADEADQGWESQQYRLYLSEKERRFRESDADWSDKEALERVVEPWPFGRQVPMSYGELLTLVAAGGRVALLADTGPADARWDLRADLLDEFPSSLRGRTLRDVIDYTAALDFVADMGPATWSKPLGRFLVVKHLSSSRAALALGSGASGVLADWSRILAGRKTVSLEDAAAMFSTLTPAQRIWMQHTPWEPLARKLWFPGDLLCGEAGRRLLAGEEVRLSELPDFERKRVLRLALRDRPWLRQEDLAQTTLTLVPGLGGDESPGPAKTLIASYHLPDDPTDRDILGTYPLSFVVPAPGSEQRRNAVIAPVPDVPPGTVASIAQTGWRYRGVVAMGGAPSGLIANDCTKEMELLTTGTTFRGLKVTEVGQASVTLTDSRGQSVTLTLQPRAPAEPQW